MISPMPPLIETIHEDMKRAMRSGETFRRDTLRFLESALKSVAIEKRLALSQLSESDIHAVIRRSIKQREDSAKQYRAGSREELAEKEDREREILSAYMPSAPDSQATRLAVEQAIEETQADSSKELGKVIGVVMKSLPHADGSEVRRIALEILS